MLPLRITRIFSIAIALALFRASFAHAQEYPNKPIRMTASEAGGAGDFVARIISQGMSAALGQPIVVVNGVPVQLIETVSKAPPDGYTLMLNGGSLWVLPLLQKTSYDTLRDFAPISLITRQVQIIAVHPSLPVKSIKELIALAKAKPGALNAGTGVIGGPNHLATYLLKSMAGINIVLVPYKGSPQAISALLSGEVQMEIYQSGLLMPHVKTGRLRALAVTSLTPSDLAPGLPTMAATLPGYEAVSTMGLWAPAKTPAAVIGRLNQEAQRVLSQPAVKEKFLASGYETNGGSPEQFTEAVKADVARSAQVIKEAGIKVE